MRVDKGVNTYLKKKSTLTKLELEDFLRLGKTRKALSQYYGVSRSTIGRRIRKWKLLGIAKKGRPRSKREARVKRLPIRMYRATIASTWYDKDAECVREYEMHFKVARPGKLRDNRRYLAKRSVPHFQHTVYRLYKHWVPKWKIKVGFEREEPARKLEQLIQIEVRRMEGKGKRWKAFPLPSRVLTYEKRKRKSQ